MKHWILPFIALTALASPALAHKGHGGLSVVRINAETGQITVTHRMAAHDVEPALPTIAPSAQPSLDDVNALWALERHLGDHFQLTVDGRPVALSRSDTRLAGDNVVVTYVGATDDREIDAVTVNLDFFPEAHEDQEILVNVRIAGVTRSARFRHGTPGQTLNF